MSETSAGETGRREAMSDERLAEIEADHATYLRDVERFGLGGLVRGARIRMAAIGDLLTEVQRLRAELDAISTHTTQQIQAWNEIGALTEQQLRERVAAAEEALEEMRGRVGRTGVAEDQCGTTFGTESAPLFICTLPRGHVPDGMHKNAGATAWLLDSGAWTIQRGPHWADGSDDA